MKTQIRADQVAEITVGLPSSPQIEKFSHAELTNLRTELIRGQLDSWQAADLTANFLAGHGYGANTENLRALIANMEMSRCTLDCLQNALEAVAYVQ
jgi:hypothetical protein